MSPALIIGVLLCLTLESVSGQNVFFNSTDSSQDSLPNRKFLQIRYQYGSIADTKTDGLQYIDTNPFQSIDFRYGVYGYGKKKWHQLHHYPTYGIGISKTIFRPTENKIGNPFSTYLFFNESLIRFRRAFISYDFSIGLAYGWKVYDPITNPDQKVIGSFISAMVGFGLQYNVPLSNRLDGTLGFGIVHFSNGRIRSPNRGLNLYGINASVQYRLPSGTSQHQGTKTFKTPSTIAYPIAPFKSFYEFYIVGAAGIVTTFQDINNRGIYYWVGSVSLDAARHYGYNGKYGVGLDWSFDQSLKVVYQNDYPGGNVPAHLLFWPGIHLSHEYMVHRWTLVTQAGVNLKAVGDKGNWYGRIGLRYDLNRFFIRTSVRIHQFVVSDFIEWGVGYSYYKK